MGDMGCHKPTSGWRSQSKIRRGARLCFHLQAELLVGQLSSDPTKCGGQLDPTIQLPMPTVSHHTATRGPCMVGPMPARLFTSSANRGMSLFQGSLSPSAILGLDHYVDGSLLLFLGRLGFRTCAYLLPWTPGSVHNLFQEHQLCSGQHLSSRPPLPAPPVVATYSKPPKTSS